MSIKNFFLFGRKVLYLLLLIVLEFYMKKRKIIKKNLYFEVLEGIMLVLVMIF